MLIGDLEGQYEQVQAGQFDPVCDGWYYSTSQQDCSFPLDLDPGIAYLIQIPIAIRTFGYYSYDIWITLLDRTGNVVTETYFLAKYSGGAKTIGQYSVSSTNWNLTSVVDVSELASPVTRDVTHSETDLMGRWSQDPQALGITTWNLSVPINSRLADQLGEIRLRKGLYNSVIFSQPELIIYTTRPSIPADTRIKRTFTPLQYSLTRIKQLNLISQMTGASAIQNTAEQHGTGISRIYGTRLNTSRNRTRILKTNTDNLTGQSRIYQTTKIQQNSQTHITLHRERGIGGSASIFGTTTNELIGIGRIRKTGNATETCIMRVKTSKTENIIGTTSIHGGTEKTETGLSRIIGTLTYSQTSSANIRRKAYFSVSCLSAIQASATRQLSSQSRLQVSSTSV